MAGKRVDMRGAFVTAMKHAGRTRASLIVTATCSWCGYENAQCVAVMRRVGTMRLPHAREMPAFTITDALCNSCHNEYWLAGGADIEAV